MFVCTMRVDTQSPFLWTLKLKTDSLFSFPIFPENVQQSTCGLKQYSNIEHVHKWKE